ncbi:MAG: hypothetical protein J5753_02040 [Oscillospiraceae bacterium]|nr:hypothetical protein [Oscillospiraceae bacterium]
MESLVYKCPNCAADIKFSAKEQKFHCEYCLSSFTQEEMKTIAAAQEQQAASRPKEEVAVDAEFAEQTSVYTCSSCGAQIMADDNTAATFCYYCHNPVILSGRVSGDFRPSYVLPFQLERDLAVQHFKDFVKKRWFLPKDFLSSAQQERITGLYVPFWVTDVDVNAEMDALGKKVRSWTSGNYEYTETREYAVARKAKVVLRGLPADGASHIDDDLMEAIEPFDYKAVKPFAMQYLSGFFAEKYDMNMSKMFPRIQQRAVQASDQLVRGSMVNYTTVSVTRSDIRVMGTTWEYMLLPVWFMTYKYKDKVYEFALNGQTGKFAGTPPLCMKRVLLFSGLLGLLVGALGFLIGGFMAS